MKILMWFAARGWALGGALAGGIVAALTSPPYYLVDQGWFTVAMFGAAAIWMGLLAVWPWKDWLRNVAVSSFVFAVMARSFGLVFQGQGSTDTRMIGAVAWFLVAFFTVLLGLLTSQAGRRARQ